MSLDTGRQPGAMTASQLDAPADVLGDGAGIAQLARAAPARATRAAANTRTTVQIAPVSIAQANPGTPTTGRRSAGA